MLTRTELEKIAQLKADFEAAGYSFETGLDLCLELAQGVPILLEPAQEEHHESH